METLLYKLDEVEFAFRRFLDSTVAGRALDMPALRRICDELRFATDDSYVRDRCGRFIGTCESLAKQRQPAGYTEDKDRAYALGDLLVVRDWIQENRQLGKN